jgi:CheY-like chemotaxis protein
MQDNLRQTSGSMVLIVDDEEHNRRVLADFLEILGYESAEAGNGLEALAWMRQHNAEVVLLDMMMPVMDGMECLRHIRRDSHLQTTPVIVVSAMADRAMLEKCVREGAEDYLFKPVDRALLSARLEGTIRKYRQFQAERRLRKRMEELVAGQTNPPSIAGVPTQTPHGASFSRPAATPLTLGNVRLPRRLSYTLLIVIALCCVLLIGFPLSSRTSQADPEMVSVPTRHSDIATQPAAEMSSASISVLHCLAVGISDYRFATGFGIGDNENPDLPFAAVDAKSIVEQIQKIHDDRLFSRIEATLLVDQAGTREAIVNNVAALRRKADLNDFCIVWFAGHGVRDDRGDFCFAPCDFKWDGAPAATGVRWSTIIDEISAMPCSAFIVMDACHSGAITKNIRGTGDGLKRDIDQAVLRFRYDSPKGRIVMAASLGHQYANERKEWGHSALALATLEALSGRSLHPDSGNAELNRLMPPAGVVNVDQLNQYVTERVSVLTRDSQNVITRDTGDLALSSFPLGVRSASDH